jgi:hypothetical protein
LDPENPIDNPFLHDRQKTFQPRELWEWLLKFAILMFPLDVAVRRVQLEREEMQRAWRKIRSKVFFWQGVPREPEAEESLAALLARRDQVRSTQTAASEPNPDLFRPEKPVVLPAKDVFSPPSHSGAGTSGADQTGVAVEEQEPEQQATSTTSRLLDAKRRAQKRKE